MIRPMLAKAGDLPVGHDWLYEIKWDGVRCVATVKDGRVTMESRSAKTDWTVKFPAIAAALARLPFDVILDGEIVTPDENGHTFGLGAGAGSVRPARLIVFDVLELFGKNVRAMPLTDRRKLLDGHLRDALMTEGPGVLDVSPTFDDGETLLAFTCDHGLEGIVAKRRSSRYLDGRRGDEWLKVKVRKEQEFVVCGWTPGKNGRTGRIGGLVLGQYQDDGTLVYCGRAGMNANYDTEMENRLGVRVGAFTSCPFPRAPREERDATWVNPHTVVQVAYQRWTDDGRLTHPVLKRVRVDKEPRDVTVAGREA